MTFLGATLVPGGREGVNAAACGTSTAIPHKTHVHTYGEDIFSPLSRSSPRFWLIIRYRRRGSVAGHTCKILCLDRLRLSRPVTAPCAVRRELCLFRRIILRSRSCFDRSGDVDGERDQRVIGKPVYREE